MAHQTNQYPNAESSVPSRLSRSLADPFEYAISYVLTGEHPTWAVDSSDGPHPLCCYRPGDSVLCPMHLKEHPPAHTVGFDGEACGVICHACKHIYHADFRALTTPTLYRP